MCPLCLATLVGATLAATGSTAAVTSLVARLIVPKPPQPVVESKEEEHAQNRVS
jgi:hypothetical protein